MKHLARLVAASICAVAALSPVTAAPPEIRTDSGRVVGVSGRTAAVRVFKGIPFAAPPVGSMRWRAPHPVIPWNGVRQANEFGPRCVQIAGNLDGLQSGEAAAQPMSEDCLYLNVWTAAESGSARRPVLVWSHGGAFRVGAGSLPEYDGEALARKGIILVTYNYRLGPFGFLAHPDLTKESGRNASGNYGLMDSVAALQWVQKNIAAFGGDPDRVTVMGQSAGGFLTQFSVVSPRIPRLFQRAIVQSASVRIDPFPSLAEAERAGQEAATKLGAPSLAALRGKSAEEIQLGILGTRPTLDGWYLSEQAWTSLASGRHKNIDLLIGSNKDEGTFPYLRGRAMGLGDMTALQFTAYVHGRFGTNADTFLKLYPAGSDDQATISQLAAFSDEASWNGRFWAAAHASRSTTKAYLYRFAHEPPVVAGQPNRRATHTAEIPYVFNIPGPSWTDVDRRLADTMSSYWVNFARLGDPNGPGLPRWSAFKPGDREQQMILGPTVESGPTLDSAHVALFNALLQHLVPQAAGRPASR
jgi:para-nitrobenzyl esterase